jgi:hypothetical protein
VGYFQERRTVVLAIFSLVAVDVIYAGRHQLASIRALLSANVLMIFVAAFDRDDFKVATSTPLAPAPSNSGTISTMMSIRSDFGGTANLTAPAFQ